MASVDTGGGEAKKGKLQKQSLRVDFTPMVDMNMLLITFFMFCTTLSKPQIMNIAMPTNDETVDEKERDKVPESKTVTLLLGKDHKVYFYYGKPNYDDYTSLKETTFDPNGGVRKILLEKNGAAIAQMKELKAEKKKNKRMSEDDFKEQAGKIKNDKETAVVVIKATSESTYKDLVDALDEMQICSIGKYAIVPMAEGDQFLLDNLDKKGALSAQADKIKK